MKNDKGYGSKRQGSVIKCKTCGREFYVKPNRLLKNVKYCSRQCKGEGSKIINVCKQCGKSFWKLSRGLQLYCSRQCAAKGRTRGKTIKCDYCGKEAYKSQSLYSARTNHFCSNSCSNKFQGLSKKVFICIECGNDFKLSKSVAKQGNPLYCSWNCRIKDKKHMKMSSLKGNLAQLKKRGLNKLELTGQNILKEMGVSFKEQIIVFGKFTVDVLILEKKLIIQWDGDYWHSLPKRKRLDKSQDAYLRKCGFRVLRFSETQLKKERDVVCANIERAIQ